MKIYVASSWKNQQQPAVVLALRAAGHEVYDFRNPAPRNKGFSWSEIDPNWKRWTPADFIKSLNHPIARKGFRLDIEALADCDACVLVLPCGRSAHLEAGFAMGAARLSVILLQDERDTIGHSMNTRASCSACGDAEGCHVAWRPQIVPELMYAMANLVTDELQKVIKFLAQPISGVCTKCGCTEDNACPDGCTWTNKKRTLCSACK